MGDYRAIADVGKTLVELLNEKMSNELGGSIILGSPTDVTGNSVSLLLFLYKAAENPSMKNQVPQNMGVDRLKEPPLVLDLYYMLTTFAPGSIEDVTKRTQQQHELLGDAMRVLYDNAILSGSRLKGSLAGSSEELRITLNPLALDDLHKIWNIFPQQSFRASLGYIVTPVVIDSLTVRETTRVLDSNIVIFNEGGIGHA